MCIVIVSQPLNHSTISAANLFSSTALRASTIVIDSKTHTWTWKGVNSNFGLLKVKKNLIIIH